MLTCLNCQSTLPDYAASCPTCGRLVERRCSACNAEISPGSNFCDGCGRWTTHSAQTSPDRHIRRERKTVTVLFADMKGSLSLITGTDPERAAYILDQALALMRDAVHKFGGIVNRVQGDGIMALFGAPVACEDHALRACYAASDMLASARRTSTSSTQNLIGIRVGIHSGEVIVRPVASDIDVHYGVTGETVHLAARMEQNADVGTAYITEDTYRLAGVDVDVEALGLIQIKGCVSPVPVYRLGGVSPKPVRAGVHQQRTLPFVDRSSELRTLRAVCQRVEAGRGAAILLSGEAGTGKSRLIHHFAEAILPTNWLALQCRGLAYRAIGDATMRLLIAGALKLPDTCAPEACRSLIHRHLTEVLGKTGGAEHGSALASLFPLSDTDPAWEALPPKSRRQRVEVAVCTLFAALSLMQPLMLIIDDAQYVDEASSTYLSALIKRVRKHRILIVAIARPGATIALNPKSIMRGLALGPLSRGDVVRLMELVCVPTSPLRDFSIRLRDTTRGNPLYLEQCLYALSKDDIISTRDSRYVVQQSVREIRVPEGIRALLAARADKLADLHKDVLQVASVAGEKISTQLLRHVIDLPEFQLDQILSELSGGGFLIKLTERDQHVGYSFIHGLMRDTLYESIPRRSRVALHGRLLVALKHESQSSDELLAEHAIRGEVWQTAAEYYLGAGTKAFEQDFKTEAIRLLRLGIDAASKIREDDIRARVILDLRLGLRNPLFQLGRIDELRNELDEAMPIAVAINDSERLGRWLSYQSHLLWFTGDSVGALEAAKRAKAVGESMCDTALEIRARFQEGLVFLTQSRLGECIQAMRDVLSRGDDQCNARYGLNRSLAITARSYLARASAENGDLKTARQAMRVALMESRVLREPFARIFALIGRGFVAIHEGKIEIAIKCLRSACALCDRADVPLLRPVAASFLAFTLIKRSQFSEASVIARSAVEAAERAHFAANQPFRLAVLADSLWHLGNIQESASLAKTALSIGTRQSEPVAVEYAYRVLCRSGASAPLPMQ
jgi:class 3 adenylate cyclase/tetratricopeptide (TPR) repeat protein